MNAIVQRLWEKDEPLLFISKEQYVKSLEGWEIVAVPGAGGEFAFVALVNGPEFHFQSFGTKAPLTRKTIHTFLARIIQQNGYAQTRTPKDDSRQHRFNRLLGFVVVGEDEYDVIYRIERI